MLSKFTLNYWKYTVRQFVVTPNTDVIKSDNKTTRGGTQIRYMYVT